MLCGETAASSVACPCEHVIWRSGDNALPSQGGTDHVWRSRLKLWSMGGAFLFPLFCLRAHSTQYTSGKRHVFLLAPPGASIHNLRHRLRTARSAQLKTTRYRTATPEILHAYAGFASEHPSLWRVPHQQTDCARSASGMTSS